MSYKEDGWRASEQLNVQEKAKRRNLESCFCEDQRGQRERESVNVCLSVMHVGVCVSDAQAVPIFRSVWVS